MEIKFNIGDKVIINAGYFPGTIGIVKAHHLLEIDEVLAIGYKIVTTMESQIGIYYLENEILPYNEVTKVLYGK